MENMSLSVRYEHNNSEKKWQQYWEEQAIYKWDSNDDNVFSIDTPPPTVSGVLHMGHIYSYSHADFIARYQRMRGKNVFFPIGFDDNGLPTERLVEKDKGVKAGKISRDQFIEICRTTIKHYENDFENLFKSMALSFDWLQKYQTISDQTSKISQASFLDLYEKGLVYRKHAPTFWDIVDQTAIAQAEIEDKEKIGLLSTVQFAVEGGEIIKIATTRLEMLPACVAIFCHPDDTRYHQMIGQRAIVPIFGQHVPIIADHEVDPEKGTGVVMCCTFGDIQDIRWWKRYDLATKECVNKYGKMQNAGFLNELKITEARETALKRLQEMHLITETHEVTQHVKCAERSGSILEIILTNQWYIAVMDHKEVLMMHAKKVQWHPENMRIRLENWIHGLNQDWCISRQRYFGVALPVWYSKRQGEEGKILLPSLSKLPVFPMQDLPEGYSREEVEPELDVLDTWATSSLTPQIMSYGINLEHSIDTVRYNRLFPFDLRTQAHEIIRTWAFSTIVKSCYHANSHPWHHVMISGWCLAADKTKMSKSKGNTIAPQRLISERGADAIRYWASTSKLGADTFYSEDSFKVGERLLNKIWNVAKFSLIHLPKLRNEFDSITDLHKNRIVTEPIDLWIIAKLQHIVRNVTDSFDNFEYCDARNIAEDFFWKLYCDNYIELVKHRLYNDDNQSSQQSGIVTIAYCLTTLLKLFAPFFPHITEEIYQTVFPNKLTSIHQRGAWPRIEVEIPLSDSSVVIGDASVKLLDLVRKAKSDLNISIAKEVQCIEIISTIEDVNLLSDFKAATHALDIKIVGKASVSNERFLFSSCGTQGVCLINI